MNVDGAKGDSPGILSPEAYAYSRGHAAARAGNLLEAQEWWMIGTDLGHPFSEGMLRALSAFDATQDPNLYWHEAAAELGDPQSMDVLGFLLEQAGDTQRACALYQRAATLGNQHSMNRLGVLAAELGLFDEARAWWEASGDAIGYENLRKLDARENESPVSTAEMPHPQRPSDT